MKRFSLKKLFLIVTLITILMGCWRAFHIFTRWQSCKSSVAFFTEMAQHYRKQAAREGIPPEHKAAYLRTADEYDDYRQLYSEFLKRPWSAYPWESEAGRQLAAKHLRIQEQQESTVPGRSP